MCIYVFHIIFAKVEIIFLNIINWLLCVVEEGYVLCDVWVDMPNLHVALLAFLAVLSKKKKTLSVC
jgi:hypothetical protein